MTQRHRSVALPDVVGRANVLFALTLFVVATSEYSRLVLAFIFLYSIVLYYRRSFLSICFTSKMNADQRRRRKKRFERKFGKSLLLVIAHPDDETMFFSPTIRELVSAGIRIYVLCLSTGNFDGLGNVRREEIVAATKLFGIPQRNVRVVDDVAFRDGPREIWTAKDISKRVMATIQAIKNVDCVLTFDRFGVSGHPNHVACAEGVASACSERLLNNCWCLCSSQPPAYDGNTKIFDAAFDFFSLLRFVSQIYSTLSRHFFGLLLKYLGPFGVVFFDASVRLSSMRCAADVDDVATLTNVDVPLVWSAMRAHRSQFVWYRRLFVVFSHFSFANTLVRLKRAKAQFA